MTLEFELLRAPAPAVAKALLESPGGAVDDTKLRDRLLAGGATTLAHCAVAGPYGQELKYGKMKVTGEPFLFQYAALWQTQAFEKKRGEEVTSFEGAGGEVHETGCTLRAEFEEVEGGMQATIRFKWAGSPVVRSVNTWPVKDRVAKVIQDRVWELETQWTENSGVYRLLAAAPEPPYADGNATGFIYAAFGKLTPARRDPAKINQSSSGATQCWTFEIPEDAARKLLAERVGADGDEKQLRTFLLEEGTGQWTPLNSVCSLRCDEKGIPEGEDSVNGEPGRVKASLEWQEPRGFGPADTRFVPFIPVPNDAFLITVEHRMESESGCAFLTQPVGPVKWLRWYGSTRGVADEAAGVDSSAIGATSCQFALQRMPGRVFLANAHRCGAKTRLTFARAFLPKSELLPVLENTLQILETPLEPWLTRLTAGSSMASLLPNLTAALANGTAEVLHTEVCTIERQRGWKREDTWPWMAIAADYINPSIHNQKFCFNPRTITQSSPPCRMEIRGGIFDAAICGEPISRRFGLWLPGVPGFSAETSTLALSEWPSFRMSAATIPQGRDLLLEASLGRAWRHPEKRAIHWFLFRSAPPPDAKTGEPAPVAEALSSASFTITSADGAVLAHVTLPAGSAEVEDGRILQSLEPRDISPVHYFQEAVPPEAPKGGKVMNGQTSIASALDGTRLTITKDTWTIEYSLAPARRITETLTALTEQPDGKGDYKSESIPVSCERLVMNREKLTGALPGAGDTLTRALDGDRKLTVRVR